MRLALSCVHDKKGKNTRNQELETRNFFDPATLPLCCSAALPYPLCHLCILCYPFLMTFTRPDVLASSDLTAVPHSLRRILKHAGSGEHAWIGPEEARSLSEEDQTMYRVAGDIMKHIAIRAPLEHKSGHPGGPLSAFTFSFALLRRRNPHTDAALRMSAGHLSLLAYTLQWLGGRGDNDERLASPEAIIQHFRTIKGLPGHSEAGIGDIPFGFGPLGKGVSNALGHALGWKMRKKPGITDVLMGDGDSQEGQIMEAARLAVHTQADTLMVHADINDIQLSDIPTNVVAADLANIFHGIGWNVIEVQDGNDPAQVEAALDKAESFKGNKRPTILCYYTTMGHGVETMEEASNEGKPTFHGAPMDKEDADKELAKLKPLDELVAAYEPMRKVLKERYKGAPAASTPLPVLPKIPREILKDKGAARKDLGAVHIMNAMKLDERVVVLHGDLGSSGGFDKVEQEFPNRVINCGAAEANMYMVAAGMRQAGLIPVTYTFAAFGTNEARANARLIDINAEHVPCAVLHDCTHAGLSVGEDGETHQERNYFTLPLDNTQVWMPADTNQAGAMAQAGLNAVADGKISTYIFSPRTGQSSQVLDEKGNPIYGADYVYEGKADKIRGHGDIKDAATILTVGQSLYTALKAYEILKEEPYQVPVRILNVSSIRPIDSGAIIKAALETRHLIVVEDHNTEGGLATQVADLIADFQLPCSLRRLGVNHYFPSGPSDDLLLLAGLDEESIVDAVLDEVKAEVSGGEDAFVTFLFALHHNRTFSRFGPQAREYIDLLADDEHYLQTLRAYWKELECPPDQLPGNEQLQQMLRREHDEEESML